MHIRNYFKETNCPRCGTLVTTINRSQFGNTANNLKAFFEGLCADCITPSEHKSLLEIQAMEILKGGRQFDKTSTH
jgi:Protein of unknown function (DUF2688)